jgi:hypothetical protein
MSDSKDIRYSTTGQTNGHSADHYEKGPSQERRRSSIVDLNRDKNLDAK